MLTLSELAIYIPVSIDFFEYHDMDYYQNGNKTLDQVCQLRGYDFEKMEKELNEWVQQNEHQSFINLMELDIHRLMGYIHKTYHSKEEESLQSITQLILLVKTDHIFSSKKRDYLIRNIDIEFNKLKEHLLEHFDHEDRIFFPYIEKLINAKNVNLNIPGIHISAIKNPIRVLKNEHEEAIDRLHEIKSFTHNFEEFDKNDTHYNCLMQHFRQFTKNMHMHMHLENNILFPKLLDIESFVHNRIKEKFY